MQESCACYSESLNVILRETPWSWKRPSILISSRLIHSPERYQSVGSFAY